MTDKKELNLDELESVNGGHFRDKYLPADKGEHIYATDAKYHINENVYFVCDSDREIYGWGKLLISDKAPEIGGTYIFHSIYVEGRNNYEKCDIELNRPKNIRGDQWTLFKKNG